MKQELLYRFNDVKNDRFVLLFELDKGYMVSSNAGNQDWWSSAKQFYYHSYKEALDKFNKDCNELIGRNNNESNTNEH